VEGAVKYLIFNCCVKDVIEVNRTVVHVKYTIDVLELTVVRKNRVNKQFLPNNVVELQKKGPVVEIKQGIALVAVIYTNIT
jgi:hypothetical protein